MDSKMTLTEEKQHYHMLKEKYNIHVAENPNKIHITWEIIPDELKPLFSIPYVEQGSDIWLKKRQDYITGSQVGYVLGHAPSEWGNAHSVFDEKCEIGEKKQWSTDQMKALSHGINNEPKAAYIYAKHKNDVTFKFGILVHADKEWDFLGISPDRITLKKDILEIKCPFYRKIKSPFTLEKLKKYMPYYYDQCQLQLTILHSHNEIFNSLQFVQYGMNKNDKKVMEITNVPYDKEWFEAHASTLSNFWNNVTNFRTFRNTSSIPKSLSLTIDYSSEIVQQIMKRKCPFKDESNIISKKIKYDNISTSNQKDN